MEFPSKPSSIILERLRFPYRNDKLFSLAFFVVLFLPLAFFNYFTEGFEAPKLILWLACSGIAVIILFWQRSLILRYHKMWFILFGLFLAWSIIASIISFDRINSLLGLPGRFTSSLLFHTLWVGWMIIFLISLDAAKRIFLLKTFVVTSLIIALLGILQHAGFAFYPGINAPVRVLAPSFLGNPNFSSMFIAGAVPLALLFLARSQSLPAKLYYAATAFLVTWSVMLFASRGSIVGLWAGLAIFVVLGLLWFRTSRRLLVYTCGAIVISAVLFAAFYGVSRPGTASQTLALSETTVDSRLMIWSDSLKLIGQRPWTGTGLGNFFIAFKQLGNPVFNTGERFDDAHNVFLHQAVVGGLPLLILFILILALPVWCGLKTLRQTGDPLIAATLAALVGLLVGMSFNPTTIACWLLLAVLLSSLMWPAIREKSVTLASAWIRPTSLIFGLIFIVAAGVFFTSEYLAFKGLTAYRANDFSAAEFNSRLAYSLNPTNSSAVSYWAASLVKQNRDPHQSEQLIERLKYLHPVSSGTYHTAAVLYYLLNLQAQTQQYSEKIVNSLERAVQLEPNYGPLYGQAAYIYFKDGNEEKTLEYLRKSLAANNRQFYQWVLLAQVYQGMGQREQMIYAFEQAYLLQPEAVLLKKTLQAIKHEPDLSRINLPIYFPELNL